MNAHRPPGTVALLLALSLAACQGSGTVQPTLSPSGVAYPAATATSDLTATPVITTNPADVPAGRILFHRLGSDGVERYFTVKTDGTDEHALYEAEGCECARWMADGKHVMTLGPTGRDTWSFSTYLFDGTDRDVVDNPIRTLNLAPGATTLDGRLIAFNGWDETNPTNTGLYVASPDLKDLHLVLPLQEGWLAVEPFGISPDGSSIVFFIETGPDGGITHSGDLYVVSSIGTGLRQLNPTADRIGFLSFPVISMSPDGRQAAFVTHEMVYVVDLEGGPARPITNQPGFAWAVSWSPTGEWITYAKFHGRTSVVSLIRPDGTDQREISANDETDEANAPAWSPDGNFLLVARDSDASVDGPQDLWIMDLEGRWVTQVTHEPSTYGTYSWAPASGS